MHLNICSVLGLNLNAVLDGEKQRKTEWFPFVSRTQTHLQAHYLGETAVEMLLVFRLSDSDVRKRKQSL